MNSGVDSGTNTYSQKVERFYQNTNDRIISFLSEIGVIRGDLFGTRSRINGEPENIRSNLRALAYEYPRAAEVAGAIALYLSDRVLPTLMVPTRKIAGILDNIETRLTR